MNDTLNCKLDSFHSTLAVAFKDEFKPLWLNQPPLAFSEGITEAQADVASLVKQGAEQSVKTTGPTDALKGLRLQFEKALHPITRASYQCLTKLGRVEDAAKLDLSPTDLHTARAQALAGMGETILDLAEPLTKAPAAGQPAPGEKYGVTAAKVTALDALWERYSTAVGKPRSARSERKARTDALPGNFAAVEAKFAILDDLIIQFNGTEVGDRFVDAWFNARRVIDTGRRANKPTPPPEPPPTPPAQNPTTPPAA